MGWGWQSTSLLLQSIVGEGPLHGRLEGGVDGGGGWGWRGGSTSLSLQSAVEKDRPTSALSWGTGESFDHRFPPARVCVRVHARMHARVSACVRACVRMYASQPNEIAPVVNLQITSSTDDDTHTISVAGPRPDCNDERCLTSHSLMKREASYA